ncbi:hypothetical protein QTO34_001643 [Cnephaeus nilssonii]|uniref:Uncharacterized protein n=1 Tax=Cnephaeus nilssonii TaxID=3371016 RepID=A0AA40HX21_CNENI|nr:hypothetical protein QTO34_001643 [Eptesicus nilssonii]
MVSRTALAALLLVHVAALLASQTEAFVPIFTHSELPEDAVPTNQCPPPSAHCPVPTPVAQVPQPCRTEEYQEKERNREQKKSLGEQQRSEEVGPLDTAELTEGEDGQVIKVSGQAADAETPGGVPWPATERARAQPHCSRGNWNEDELQAAGEVPAAVEGLLSKGLPAQSERAVFSHKHALPCRGAGGLMAAAPRSSAPSQDTSRASLHGSGPCPKHLPGDNPPALPCFKTPERLVTLKKAVPPAHKPAPRSSFCKSQS